MSSRRKTPPAHAALIASMRELRRRARDLALDAELQKRLRKDADPEVRRLARHPGFRAAVAAGYGHDLLPSPREQPAAPKRRRRGLLVIENGRTVMTAAGKPLARIASDGTITVPVAGGIVSFANGRPPVRLRTVRRNEPKPTKK